MVKENFSTKIAGKNAETLPEMKPGAGDEIQNRNAGDKVESVAFGAASRRRPGTRSD